jgi:predicted hydrolase (HD superfamily)
VHQLLAAEPEGCTFEGLLRRLILAVGVGREELCVDQETVRRFQKQCFARGRMVEPVRQAVMEQVGAHLEKTLENEETRRLIAEEMREEIGRLEACCRDGLERLFLLPA